MEPRIGRARADLLRRAADRAGGRDGYASYLEELDARRNLFAAQREAIVLRESQLANLVTLYETLGGGWSSGAPADAPPAPR